MPNNKQSSSDRGFASMDEEEQREIARKGGESVSDEDRSFSQNRELASEAGRKGGQQSGGDTSGNQQQRAEEGGEAGEGGPQRRSGTQDVKSGSEREPGGNFADDRGRVKTRFWNEVWISPVRAGVRRVQTNIAIRLPVPSTAA